MEPIFDDHIKLEKGEAKGSWTFVTMPIMPHLPKKKNSTVRVRGFIDDYALGSIHIWAMKKGTFLAVKTEIRKAIKKESGDTVKLQLFLDEPESAIPDDFLECLREEPKLLAHFQKWTQAKQTETIDWIFAAKTEDEKIARMAKTIQRLEAETMG
jgi:hypothetical protein